jgi:hypothetical protein
LPGPNGAGKTTFAREFLPKEEVINFVNADLLAAGLSPLKPDLAAMNAGRLFLAELDRLAAMRQDFAFESTLSGLTYLARIKRWKSAGYRIEIFFYGLLPFSSRYAVSLCVSNKEDTACPKSRSRADLNVVGRISKTLTNHWPTHGKCTIIPETDQNFSRPKSEGKKN